MKKILLVEDNEDYQLFFKLKFNELSLGTELIPFNDGTSFLNYLKEIGNSELPNLIVLDLGLPDISGFELLELLKINPALKKIPVIIFSSSESRFDIEKSYNLNANSYVVKPIGLDEIGEFISYMHKYWVNFNLVA